MAANQVRGGAGNAYIAGGVEMHVSRANGLRRRRDCRRSRIAIDNYFVPQGISADIIATKYGFTRDMADAMAVESQKRAKAAWDDGPLSQLRRACLRCQRPAHPGHDEYMRPETDMQSLGALNPSFKQMGEVMPGFDKIALLKYPELERINHIHHAGTLRHRRWRSRCPDWQQRAGRTTRP